MNKYRYRYLLRFMPDKAYLKLLYWVRTHKILNMKNPKTFTEKLQWLKLYNRRPEYTMMVDKYRVREYIEEKIGGGYSIPLVGGPWKSAEDIEFEKLPEQFVLKCNHDSGSVVICRDKSDFDFEAAKKKLNKRMKHNYWYFSREWPYKKVKPCIFAEKYMTDESRVELKDYKVFCFDGKPEIIQVDYNRFKDHKRNIYSTNWDYMDVAMQYPTSKEVIIDRPKLLEKMLELSEKLSKGIPFLRTDFYLIGDKLYFGELTFFPEGGFVEFAPKEYDLRLGDHIKLLR